MRKVENTISPRKKKGGGVGLLRFEQHASRTRTGRIFELSLIEMINTNS